MPFQFISTLFFRSYTMNYIKSTKTVLTAIVIAAAFTTLLNSCDAILSASVAAAGGTVDSSSNSSSSTVSDGTASAPVTLTVGSTRGAKVGNFSGGGYQSYYKFVVSSTGYYSI